MINGIERTGRRATARTRPGGEQRRYPWQTRMLVCGQIVLCLAALALPARADYGAAMAAFNRGQFNDGERLLRACAWRDDDIYCQLRLSDLYFDLRYPLNRRYRDGSADYVESYVWAFLAAHNVNVPGRHETIVEQFADAHKLAIRKCKKAYDKMMAMDREPPDTSLLSKSDPPAAARERIKFVLRSRGAPGHMHLSELYLSQPAKHVSRGKHNDWKLAQVSSIMIPLAEIYDPTGCPTVFLAKAETLPGNTPNSRRNTPQSVERNRSRSSTSAPTDKYALVHARRARDMKYPPADKLFSEYRSTSGIFPAEDLDNPDGEFLYPPGRNETGPFAPWDFDHTLRLPENQQSLSRLNTIFLRRELDRDGRKNAWLLKREIYHALGTVMGARITKANSDKQRNAFQRRYLDYNPHNYGKLKPWEKVQLIKLAAKRNDPSALYTLGLMYLDGRGVPMDQRLGETILKRAADEHKEPRAMCELHFIYLTGDWTGIPSDPDEAGSYRERFKSTTSQSVTPYRNYCACFGVPAGQFERRPVRCR